MLLLDHEDGVRIAIHEIFIWKIRVNKDYPDGIKYRAWVSKDGATLFGFDNHKPKGPHLHIREIEVGYVFRGMEALKVDIEAMIKKEGFIYES